jgi:uncharacterized protein
VEAPVRETPRAAQGPAWRQGAWLLAGLVVLAVGVGLGPGHAVEEGLVPAAVVGAVLLVVGGGLALWSVARLLARTRRRWWLVVIPIFLVVSYLALWVVGQAVAAAFPPRPEVGRTPEDVGLASQAVDVTSSDGVRLAGWYVPSRNGAAVVLMHGAGSTRSDVLDQAVVLAGHGYGLLLLDARGHGESDGRAMELGWWGEADAGGAVDFLATRPDVDTGRIGLLGLSMGGEQAIGAAGVDDRVAAVVAEGATNRMAADKGYLDEYGVRGEVQQQVDRLTYGLAGLLSPAPVPEPLRRSLAAATSRPDPTAFLLITAGEVETERLAADHIRGDAAGVDVWTVPGAGHTQGLATEPTEWEDRVTDFLDEALAGGGP